MIRPSLLLFFACILAFCGCARISEKEQLAQFIERDSQIRSCLGDHQIDPTQLSECIRSNQQVTNARTAAQCVPVEKNDVIRRCLTGDYPSSSNRPIVGHTIVDQQGRVVSGTYAAPP